MFSLATVKFDNNFTTIIYLPSTYAKFNVAGDLRPKNDEKTT